MAMTESNKNNDLIESYLDGTLTGDERDLFDEQLKSDPVLAEMFSERIIVQRSWKKIAQRKQIKQHISSVIKIERKRQQTQRTTWFAAASLLVLIGISSLVLIQQKNHELLSGGKILKDSQVIIQGKINEIRKYGNADTIKIEREVQMLLPKDRTAFLTKDTIIFSWPANSIKEKLVIFDENWSKVAEITLSKGTVQYKIEPNRLKPGIYTWILTPNSVKSQFSVK